MSRNSPARLFPVATCGSRERTSSQAEAPPKSGSGPFGVNGTLRFCGIRCRNGDILFRVRAIKAAGATERAPAFRLEYLDRCHNRTISMGNYRRDLGHFVSLGFGLELLVEPLLACRDLVTIRWLYSHLTANTQIAPPSTTSGNLPGN